MQLNLQDGIHTVWVDVSSSIEIAEQHFGLKVFRVSIEESEFPEDYFDVATMFDVIEHISDFELAFQAIEKNYPNGRLCVPSDPQFSRI